MIGHPERALRIGASIKDGKRMVETCAKIGTNDERIPSPASVRGMVRDLNHK